MRTFVLAFLFRKTFDKFCCCYFLC